MVWTKILPGRVGTCPAGHSMEQGGWNGPRKHGEGGNTGPGSDRGREQCGWARATARVNEPEWAQRRRRDRKLARGWEGEESRPLYRGEGAPARCTRCASAAVASTIALALLQSIYVQSRTLGEQRANLLAGNEQERERRESKDIYLS